MDPKDYLTVRATANTLQVSTRTIQLWISQGHFPNAYKLNPTNTRNSPYRIPCTDIDAFKNRQRVARPS